MKWARLFYLGVALALVTLGYCAMAQPSNAGTAQSITALTRQAESGNAEAQRNLGEAYETGKGVSRDYTQAAIWYRKAAEQGDEQAQFQLAFLCEIGRGVAQDYKQAAEWYRKAAEQGNIEAQYSLGLDFRDGKGVPQDYTQAAQWLRKAAVQGEFLAQWCLGVLYRSGQGVPQDYAEAYFWFDIAAAGLPQIQGSEKIETEITKGRDETAAHLTQADLSRVQERARKWFAAHQSKAQ